MFQKILCFRSFETNI